MPCPCSFSLVIPHSCSSLLILACPHEPLQPPSQTSTTSLLSLYHHPRKPLPPPSQTSTTTLANLYHHPRKPLPPPSQTSTTTLANLYHHPRKPLPPPSQTSTTTLANLYHHPCKPLPPPSYGPTSIAALTRSLPSPADKIQPHLYRCSRLLTAFACCSHLLTHFPLGVSSQHYVASSFMTVTLLLYYPSSKRSRAQSCAKPFNFVAHAVISIHRNGNLSMIFQ
ncbi:hypothetical protein F4604DRAFT_1913697 [Suillus subluteus]|nr:hypothetical protein F4604DRAFT_1913697 [Suillus subluteus]